MAALKKNASSLSFMAALMVVIMATALLSSCHARSREMDHEAAAVFAVPAPCYSKYFPNCTDDKCKKFCAVKGKPPVPGAFCNDKSSCCCPVG